MTALSLNGMLNALASTAEMIASHRTNPLSKGAIISLCETIIEIASAIKRKVDEGE